MIVQPVPDLELALATISTGRPRSVEQAERMLERKGFLFDSAGGFAAWEDFGIHSYRIGPDPISETGFRIEREY